MSRRSIALLNPIRKDEIDEKLKKRILEAWEDGLTAAEMKVRFSQISSDVLRALGHEAGILEKTPAGGYRQRSFYRK